MPMFLFLSVVTMVGLIVAAVVYARSTPDARAACTSHVQMARALDRIIHDDMVRPLLDAETLAHIRGLVADFYDDDEPRRLS